MRISATAFCLVAAIAALLDSQLPNVLFVEAKKSSPSRPRPAVPPPGTASRRGGAAASRSGRRPPPQRRPSPILDDDYDAAEEEEDDYDNNPVVDEDDFGGGLQDEEDDFEPPAAGNRRGARPAKSSASSNSRQRLPPAAARRRPPVDDYDDDGEEDDYDDRRAPPGRSSRGPPPRRSGGPPPRRGRGGPPPRRPGGRVVPYGKRPGPPSAAEQALGTFAKGWTVIKSSMPDAAAVREGVTASISAARQTTSHLSSNIYREVKGLTSSELEQVMLKATRPDDTPVKGKHVERLVGVTYQISARYDIYNGVLRKLWSKMAEKDWRTTIKALYILHRFSADGAPEHAPSLKARLRELRRTQDPKRKDKYFNTKQLLAGDTNPENAKFRAYMSRYAHYVLLRTQCFGGVFDEIAQRPAPPKRDVPKGKKSSAAAANATPIRKPITSTNLRVEHLEAAAMLLKAGVACQLKDGEECENTAIAAERVASDLIGLTTAVAMALNRALKDDAGMQGADGALIKRWCEFYRDELLPQTRAMVKRTSSKLDAYGLFLPSRMGASLSPEILEKGLKADELFPSPTASTTTNESAEEEAMENAEKEEEEAPPEEEEEEEETAAEAVAEEAAVEEEAAAVDEGNEYDEYEYEEEEYYDDEDA